MSKKLNIDKEEKIDKEKQDKEELEESSIVDKINNHFKMPIYYNNDKVELKKNIITDLELTNTFDASCSTIYSFYFDNDNDVSKKLTEQISTYYTNDIHFLKDNQKLVLSIFALSRETHTFSPSF